MDIEKYLSEEVIEYIYLEIQNAQGNEVFFTGQIDESGIVVSAKVGCRGNSNTVPVNFSDMRDCSVIIHNHPSGNLFPSNADLGVASGASENAQGFYIINNDVSDIYVVVEPVKLRVVQKLDIEDSGAYISEGGALSKLSQDFEERTSQVELLKHIAYSFNEEKISVFEAGTGVGKSFAYLIPSILWSIQNKEKVIISTGTINLQQQLCEKDIPAVEKILNEKIKYVLLKGRQNYVCKRRLADAVALRDLFDDELEEMDKLASWAQETDCGDKSELTFMPSENNWSKINSESDACMGLRCPYHNECFVMKVRKEASAANIIVVNHHLLFSDIQFRLDSAGYDDAAVLPPYRRIVFDEAHGIESAATSFFSESFTRFKVNKLLNQMYRTRKNSTSGHLCTLAIVSSNEEKVSDAYELVSKIKNDILNLEIATQDLIQNNYTLRLCEQTARDFGPILVSIGELANSLGSFCELVRVVMEGIDDDDKDIPAFFESKIILRRLDAFVILLKNFAIWDEKKNDVFWILKKRLPPGIAKDGTNPEFYVYTQTPLDISSLMNQGVFEEMKTVICTSATLRTGTNFNYWMRRTGVSFVERERVISCDFPSPFPYEKNMLFAVPNDAVMADSFEFQQYIQMAIPRLIEAANGSTLVLFTSYDSLKSAHAATCASLKGFSGRIMKQGDDDNGKLLEAFKQEKESVLFATDSFWQGVDVPGDSLRQVIIVKLPFTVPNDPVFVARSEAIEKKGGNAFMELSVPEAVIKFRQGIGRLIRKSDDKGVVVVLDRRIYEKRYGSIFTASMPRCKTMYDSLINITKKVSDFLE